MNLLLTPYFIMFDIIDPDLFEDCVCEHFDVLDGNYVAEKCRDLHASLRETFEGAYETRYIILDKETCKPVNVNAIVGTHDAADEFVKILGEDKHMVGFLLIER